MSPDTPSDPVCPAGSAGALPQAQARDPGSPAPIAQAPALPPLGKRPRLHSEHLFRGQDEVEIVHGQALYRLRITSLGKLILTK